MAAPPAGRRLQRDGLLDLLRRDQGALSAGVARLAPALAARRRLRRSAFDVRRVGGRRPGGVAGVPVEPLSEFIHLSLAAMQLLLILPDEGQDRRLGGRRNLVPEFSRDQRLRLHPAGLRTRPAEGKSQGINAYFPKEAHDPFPRVCPVVTGGAATHRALEWRGPMLELLVALGLVAIAIGLPLLMTRGLIQMWRDKGRTGTLSSGVAGAASELDHVVRPSAEHVLEAKNSAKEQEDDIGGD
jgi:hypothetical protein